MLFECYSVFDLIIPLMMIDTMILVSSIRALMVSNILAKKKEFLKKSGVFLSRERRTIGHTSNEYQFGGTEDSR